MGEFVIATTPFFESAAVFVASARTVAEITRVADKSKKNLRVTFKFIVVPSHRLLSQQSLSHSPPVPGTSILRQAQSCFDNQNLCRSFCRLSQKAQTAV